MNYILIVLGILLNLVLTDSFAYGGCPLNEIYANNATPIVFTFENRDGSGEDEAYVANEKRIEISYWDGSVWKWYNGTNWTATTPSQLNMSCMYINAGSCISGVYYYVLSATATNSIPGSYVSIKFDEINDLDVTMSCVVYVQPINRFDDNTDYVRIVDGTGTGEINTASGNVPVTQAFPTNFASQSIDTSGRVLLQSSQPATTFTSLTVTGTTTMSDGLVVARSTANQPAISATGNGQGSGVRIRSGTGAYADGLNIASQASLGGHGTYSLGTGTGFAAGYFATANNADAIFAAGNGTGYDINADIQGNLSGSAGSVTGLTASNLDTTISSRASQSSVDAVDNFVDTEITDIQNRLTASLVGGRMSSDMVAMSGDTVAADNLESAYDGTGYCDGCITVTVSSGVGTMASPAVLSVTNIITYDSQFDGRKLRCGNEEHIIVKTVDDTTDSLVITPSDPFIGALTGCYIE